MQPSDFSSACMPIVRLLPSWAVRSAGRTRMRSPKFRRAHGVYDCARLLVRKPFARGGCCFPASRTASAPRNSTRFAAQYPARGRPCERFKLALAGSPCITRGRRGWLGLTPLRTCTSYPLASLLSAPCIGSTARMPEALVTAAVPPDVCGSLRRNRSPARSPHSSITGRNVARMKQEGNEARPRRNRRS
jgi:hypothetical protein